MENFLRYSPLGLFILSVSIGFFYMPELPVYVLGGIGESVGSWAFVNFTISITLGILALFNLNGLIKGKLISLILIVLTLCLIFLHGLPALSNWIILQSDGMIRNDQADPVVLENLLMFIWHISIIISSITVLLTSLFQNIINRPTKSIT